MTTSRVNDKALEVSKNKALGKFYLSGADSGGRPTRTINAEKKYFQDQEYYSRSERDNFNLGAGGNAKKGKSSANVNVSSAAEAAMRARGYDYEVRDNFNLTGGNGNTRKDIDFFSKLKGSNPEAKSGTSSGTAFASPNLDMAGITFDSPGSGTAATATPGESNYLGVPAVAVLGDLILRLLLHLQLHLVNLNIRV